MIVIISDISNDNHFYQQVIVNKPDYTVEAFVHLNIGAEDDEDVTWKKSGEFNQL